MKLDTLTLGRGHRKGETLGNGMSKAERNYIDFIVSGQSLGQIFGIPNFDRIGTFGWSPNKEYENNRIDEFLGIAEPELTSGRTSFYVCPQCGDIGCGAITATIEVTDTLVIWKDFGYEDDYSEPELADYKQIGPFTFDKTEYFAVIETLKTLTA